MVAQIAPADAVRLLAAHPDAVLLDVREAWEVQLAPLKQPFVHAPLRSVPARLHELDRHAPILCLCHHGGRSMQAAYFLAHQGFDNVYNVAGGIEAWSQTVDAAVPRY